MFAYLLYLLDRVYRLMAISYPALRSIRYGAIESTIHDGRVVQLDPIGLTGPPEVHPST